MEDHVLQRILKGPSSSSYEVNTTRLLSPAKKVTVQSKSRSREPRGFLLVEVLNLRDQMKIVFIGWSK